MGTVTKRGESWSAKIRRKGYPVQTKTFATKFNAERWVRRVEGEMDDGGFIPVTRDTVEYLFGKFALKISPTRKGGKGEAVRINRILANAKFAKNPLFELSRLDLQTWRNHRLTEVSESTVRRELNTISSIISYCIREWGVALRVNPCSEIVRPKDAAHRTRRPTDHETAELIKAFNFNIDEQPANGRESTAWALLLAQETAMRIGEVGALEWKHVNLDENWLHLPALVNKNGKARDVPLSEFAVKLLKKLEGWGGEDGRVFRSTGAVLGTYFREVRDKLKIKDLRFHDYRHEAITRLCKIYDMPELCKIVGHSDTKQLLVYYNPTARELAQKMRRTA